MRTVSVITIGLALILAGCGDAKQSSDPGFDKRFNDNFTTKFVESCVTSASKGGVANDLASKLCTCVAGKVNARFSIREKMTLKAEQLKPFANECKASVAS